MSRFLDRVRGRLPEYPPYYAAPEGDLLRLDQNTNRWGPHPAALRVRPDLTQAHLYPQRDNQPLMDAVADAFGVAPAAVFVGNGSDEILDTLLRVLLSPGGRVATPHPSYSMYPHLCRLNRLEHVRVAYGPDFALEPGDLLEAEADLLLIANPDNPSGTVLPTPWLNELLEGFDGPVVLDEAYADYAPASLIREAGKRENLIVVRTLSKAYGLAGLRVGFGVAHPDVAELVRRAKLPFAVNQASQEVAIAALHEPEAARRSAGAVAVQRERLAAGLTRRGFAVTPSATNFVLTTPPMEAASLRSALRKHGILARTFEHEPAIADRIRFTVGRPDEVDRLLAALDAVLKEASA